VPFLLADGLAQRPEHDVEDVAPVRLEQAGSQLVGQALGEVLGLAGGDALRERLRGRARDALGLLVADVRAVSWTVAMKSS
jgi:hypothetical protein